MAKYQPIHVKIWNDPWFMDLKPTAKLLFFYLLTSPAITPSGFFRCPVRKMAFDTGLTLRRCQEALDELLTAEEGHVQFDSEGALVWIVNAAAYWPKSPRVLQSFEKALEELKNHPFVAQFRDRHQGVSRGSIDGQQGSLLREDEMGKVDQIDEIIPVGAPAKPPPRVRFFQAKKVNEMLAALVDHFANNGIKLTKPQREHLGALLKRRGHNDAVWKRACGAVGADGDPIEYMDGKGGSSGNQPRRGNARQGQRVGTSADWDAAKRYVEGDDTALQP